MELNLTLNEADIKSAVRKHIREQGIAFDAEPIIEFTVVKKILTASVAVDLGGVVNMGGSELEVLPGKALPKEQLAAFKPEKVSKPKAAPVKKVEPVVEKHPLTDLAVAMNTAPSTEETASEEEPVAVNSLFAPVAGDVVEEEDSLGDEPEVAVAPAEVTADTLFGA